LIFKHTDQISGIIGIVTQGSEFVGMDIKRLINFAILFERQSCNVQSSASSAAGWRQHNDLPVRKNQSQTFEAAPAPGRNRLGASARPDVICNCTRYRQIIRRINRIAGVQSVHADWKCD